DGKGHHGDKGEDTATKRSVSAAIAGIAQVLVWMLVAALVIAIVVPILQAILRRRRDAQLAETVVRDAPEDRPRAAAVDAPADARPRGAAADPGAPRRTLRSVARRMRRRHGPRSPRQSAGQRSRGERDLHRASKEAGAQGRHARDVAGRSADPRRRRDREDA